MTKQHPITPPLELMQQWDNEAVVAEIPEQVYIATQAARWGADHELKACVEWMKIHFHSGSDLSRQLRATRRPKAEEALDALNTIEDKILGPTIEESLIRAALERLQELEQNDE